MFSIRPAHRDLPRQRLDRSWYLLDVNLKPFVMGSVDALVERADAGAAILRFSRMWKLRLSGNTRHQLPAEAKVPPAIKAVPASQRRGAVRPPRLRGRATCTADHWPLPRARFVQTQWSVDSFPGPE